MHDWIMKILLRFNHWQKEKHRFLFPTLTFFCTIWFPVVIRFWGSTLRFSVTTDELTLWGWIVTATLYITSFFLIITDTACKKYSSSHAHLQAINESIYHICNKKYETLLNVINELSDQPPPEVIGNPRAQLNELRTRLCSCLKGVVQPDNCITVDFLYKCEFDSNWQHSGFDAVSTKFRERIITERNSSFREALDCPSGVVWYNNKKDAYNNGKYFPKSSSLKGSIYCKRITLGSEKATASLVICVSSSDYLARVGNKFEENLVLQNLEYIVNQYEKRIQIELEYFYIQQYKHYLKRKSDEHPASSKTTKSSESLVVAVSTAGLIP